MRRKPVNARILIIEDNLTNLELMTYLLGAFGHTVLVAGNGHQGLEIVRRRQPDLVVCDVQLPDIDGFEVARRLKSDPGLGSIPLIAVTALAMVGDRDRLLAAGFDGYLAKPIDPETFVHEMEVFLPTDRHGVIPVTSVALAVPSLEEAPHGETILVVDDLQVNLDLARSILVPSGYQVVIAGGMAKGLALAKEIPCDLILSDVCMSDGSGYEFLQLVRSDPQLRTTPFVLITSTMMTEKDREKGLVMGAACYLRRPIEPDVLLTEIRACLSEKRAN
jgi:two-component system cell cycle response regulator